MRTVMEVSNLSKEYRLGVLGAGSLREDVNRWVARLFGRENPSLKIEVARKATYGNTFLALDDVNFKVGEGEILGVIGHNGAGKSTLLKIISRVTSPTTGIIKIKGRVGSLLEVGTGFHPELTGRENIYMNGSILGMSRAEVHQKLDDIVEFAEISKFLDTPAKRYSSGMTVRLAFAVAAHLEPEILIFDEVLSVGDTAFQQKCIAKMQDVAGHGRTVLFVSHNLSSISMLCPRSILLARGRKIADDKTSAVLEVYKGVNHESEGQQLVERNALESDLVFTSIEVSADDPESAIQTGRDVNITIHAKARCALSKVNIGMGLYSSAGIKLSGIESGSKDTRYDIPEGRFSITVRLNELPLCAGEYRLNIAAIQDNMLLQAVESATFMHVGYDLESADQSGKYGPVHLQQDWRGIE